ncbi:efflux RND transporter periplasmic adaptor subunit [Terrimonas pollutisoli]|uniref:efflux RND transporter periplasmic adaptor subunit n=1 Tax=Terrimonas pollutisoli TaxID=3034147 RepID=UPI0023EC96A4|nr:efflux RND transporter periplasmic adaptor subunit [Terrimonas sp. H1YJ31]
MKRIFGNRNLSIVNDQWSIGKFLILRFVLCLLIFGLYACNDEKKENHSQHQQPETSKEQYTCPMHPEIIKDKPGNCPICGMDLVKKGKDSKAITGISLETLLKPTNQYVIASLPLVTAKYKEEPVEIDVLGYTAYNTSSVGTIAARINGRIEKLYVKYRYQKISKGQKIMDVYSPELLTAQQNLLFLLKSDAENTSMIEAARQRLLLLGFSEQQLRQLIKGGKPKMTVSVYSNYSGHIHEAGIVGTMASQTTDMGTSEIQTTQELNLKEGMYVQKGQAVFSIYDPGKLWILLNIYPQDMAFVKAGDKVRIVPESKPGKDFRATISYIEPVYRKGSKTIAARVNFDNRELQLPIGSQVNATVFSGVHKGLWLPKEAVLSLGLDKVVFLKTDEGFRVHKIETGHVHKKLLQVTSGLNENDSVAANAQYLVDSESFVKEVNPQTP